MPDAVLISFGTQLHPLSLFPDLLKHRRRQRLISIRQGRVFYQVRLMDHRVK